MSKRSTDSFYQSFSSLFANHLKLHSRRYMFLRKRRSFEYRHCRCLARIAIALNRCSVYEQIQYTKPPEHLCLLNKLFTVFFSSGFNVKLLHDWSNFDLPKLMPVEHISLMPSSCLSLTLIHARIHANKLLITAQPIRNLRTPASAEMNKSGSYSRRPFPSLPLPPSLFSFFPAPYPFRRLLRRLENHCKCHFRDSK